MSFDQQRTFGRPREDFGFREKKYAASSWLTLLLLEEWDCYILKLLIFSIYVVVYIEP